MEEEEPEKVMEKKLQKKLAALQKAQEIETQKKVALKYLLEPNAYERMMNVKLANPTLYDQVVGILVRLHQTGQIKGKLSEDQLINILKSILKREETQIEIKRK